MNYHSLYIINHEFIISDNLYQLIKTLVNDDYKFVVVVVSGAVFTFNSYLGLNEEIDKELELLEYKELWNKGYRFNFRRLEDKVNLYYKAVRTYEIHPDSKKYKMALVMFYKSVTNLVYGIFSVNPPDVFFKYSIDFYDEACNYAIYLTERVRVHSIDWPYVERNAWTQYIRLNSRYVHTTLPLFKSKELSFDYLVEELDYKLNSSSSPESVETPLPSSTTYQDNTDLNREKFYHQLIMMLCTFYDKEDVMRYLPITLSSLQYGYVLTEDLVQFKNILLVTVKRLVTYYSESFTLDKLSLDQSIDKSVIILILLSYLSNDELSPISSKLTSSLDFHNLLRLASVAGGETITIPTVDDLELAVASSIALSAVMFEGVDVSESRYIAKRFLGLKKDVRKLNRYIKGMTDSLTSDSLQIVMELNKNHGESFVYDLIKHLRLITNHQSSILDKLESDIPNLSSEQLMESLSTLDGSEKKLVGLMEKLINSPE